MVRLFDILGPTMVGPSSSHTAGACRLGYVVQAILGGIPEQAEVDLHGSFAMTGEGHGTKRAVVGGLLGFQPDDVRLRDSLDRASQAGLDVRFHSVDLGEQAHPNTARFRVRRGDDRIEIEGCSIGGGQIRIRMIDGFAVDLSGSLATVVVVADDVPGTVARISGMLAEENVNLATMRVDRTGRGGKALMTLELDAQVPSHLLTELAGQEWVHWVRFVPPLNA